MDGVWFPLVTCWLETIVEECLLIVVVGEGCPSCDKSRVYLWFDQDACPGWCKWDNLTRTGVTQTIKMHTVPHTRPVFESHQCLYTHVQVCGSKKLSCHAGHKEVRKSHTRGESEESIVRRK